MAAMRPKTLSKGDYWELHARRLRDTVARLQRTLGKRKKTIHYLRREKSKVANLLKEKVACSESATWAKVLTDFRTIDNRLRTEVLENSCEYRTGVCDALDEIDSFVSTGLLTSCGIFPDDGDDGSALEAANELVQESFPDVEEEVLVPIPNMNIWETALEMSEEDAAAGARDLFEELTFVGSAPLEPTQAEKDLERYNKETDEAYDDLATMDADMITRARKAIVEMGGVVDLIENLNCVLDEHLPGTIRHEEACLLLAGIEAVTTGRPIMTAKQGKHTTEELNIAAETEAW